MHVGCRTARPRAENDFLRGIDQPCGENAAALNHPLKRKIAFARSARTQRPIRNRRVELGKSVASVSKYGVVGKMHFEKMHLVQCRVDSVKHAASPSRPDESGRAIHVATDVNFSPPLPNTEMFGAATPRTSVRLIRLQAPRSYLCFGSVLLSRFQCASCARENLDTEQPFSYFYELRTQHRLESVATRTPPPICASAQGSQTALVLRTAERREGFNNYTMVQF